MNPATLSTAEAAAIWGVSPWHLRALVRDGAPLPVQPLRLGHALRWPSALVLATVGRDDAGDDGTPAPDTNQTLDRTNGPKAVTDGTA